MPWELLRLPGAFGLLPFFRVYGVGSYRGLYIYIMEKKMETTSLGFGVVTLFRVPRIRMRLFLWEETSDAVSSNVRLSYNTCQSQADPNEL